MLIRHMHGTFPDIWDGLGMILVLCWAGSVCCKYFPQFQRSLCKCCGNKGFSNIPHSRGRCEQRESGVGYSHWFHQDFIRISLAKFWRQGTSSVYFYICFLPLFHCLPSFYKTIPWFIWNVCSRESLWYQSCSISCHGILSDPSQADQDEAPPAVWEIPGSSKWL